MFNKVLFKVLAVVSRDVHQTSAVFGTLTVTERMETVFSDMLKVIDEQFPADLTLVHTDGPARESLSVSPPLPRAGSQDGRESKMSSPLRAYTRTMTPTDIPDRNDEVSEPFSVLSNVLDEMSQSNLQVGDEIVPLSVFYMYLRILEREFETAVVSYTSGIGDFIQALQDYMREHNANPIGAIHNFHQHLLGERTLASEWIEKHQIAGDDNEGGWESELKKIFKQANSSMVSVGVSFQKDANYFDRNYTAFRKYWDLMEPTYSMGMGMSRNNKRQYFLMAATFSRVLAQRLGDLYSDSPLPEFNWRNVLYDSFMSTLPVSKPAIGLDTFMNELMKKPELIKKESFFVNGDHCDLLIFDNRKKGLFNGFESEAYGMLCSQFHEAWALALTELGMDRVRQVTTPFGGGYMEADFITLVACKPGDKFDSLKAFFTSKYSISEIVSSGDFEKKYQGDIFMGGCYVPPKDQGLQVGEIAAFFTLKEGLNCVAKDIVITRDGNTVPLKYDDLVRVTNSTRTNSSKAIGALEKVGFGLMGRFQEYEKRADVLIDALSKTDKALVTEMCNAHFLLNREGMTNDYGQPDLPMYNEYDHPVVNTRDFFWVPEVYQESQPVMEKMDDLDRLVLAIQADFDSRAGSTEAIQMVRKEMLSRIDRLGVFKQYLIDNVEKQDRFFEFMARQWEVFQEEVPDDFSTVRRQYFDHCHPARSDEYRPPKQLACFNTGLVREALPPTWDVEQFRPDLLKKNRTLVAFFMCLRHLGDSLYVSHDLDQSRLGKAIKMIRGFQKMETNLETKLQATIYPKVTRIFGSQEEVSGGELFDAEGRGITKEKINEMFLEMKGLLAFVPKAQWRLLQKNQIVVDFYGTMNIMQSLVACLDCLEQVQNEGVSPSFFDSLKSLIKLVSDLEKMLSRAQSGDVLFDGEEKPLQWMGVLSLSKQMYLQTAIGDTLSPLYGVLTSQIRQSLLAHPESFLDNYKKMAEVSIAASLLLGDFSISEGFEKHFSAVLLKMNMMLIQTPIDGKGLKHLTRDIQFAQKRNTYSEVEKECWRDLERYISLTVSDARSIDRVSEEKVSVARQEALNDIWQSLQGSVLGAEDRPPLPPEKKMSRRGTKSLFKVASNS
ncbi:hypothetical protein HOH87_03945 [bacterium]|nr:hypothetical protein [bacterium]